MFADHLADPDELVDRLAPYPIVVAMRERTAFPARCSTGCPTWSCSSPPGTATPPSTSPPPAAGVTVCGTGGDLHRTSELTWALILACARYVPTEVANVRGGGWMTTVGSRPARPRRSGCAAWAGSGPWSPGSGQAFGMELIAWSQNLTAERCAEVGAGLVAKDELFRRSDVLTVHLVLSRRTRPRRARPSCGR